VKHNTNEVKQKSITSIKYQSIAECIFVQFRFNRFNRQAMTECSLTITGRLGTGKQMMNGMVSVSCFSDQFVIIILQ